MDEVFLMNGAEQLNGKLLLHERPVDEALGFLPVKLVLPLEFYLFAERLPASLNPVNAHRDGFDQIKVLGVLGEEWLRVTEATTYR